MIHADIFRSIPVILKSLLDTFSKTVAHAVIHDAH